jgi:hypothetical protein
MILQNALSAALPERRKAKEAAFLLEVKDWLNWLAYPARGLTIAYMTMFSESRIGCGYMLWQSYITK